MPAKQCCSGRILYISYCQVKKWVPNLKIEYAPDSRQNIADSWPMVFDDSLSRQEWGWNHDIDLAKLVEIMITNLKKTYPKQE